MSEGKEVRAKQKSWPADLADVRKSKKWNTKKLKKHSRTSQTAKELVKKSRVFNRTQISRIKRINTYLKREKQNGI